MSPLTVFPDQGAITLVPERNPNLQSEAFEALDTTEGGFRLILPEKLHPVKTIHPITCLIIGRRGQGKTLSMVHLMELQTIRARKYGIQRKFFSNIWMRFVDSQGVLAMERELDEETGEPRIVPIRGVDPYILERLAFGLPRYLQNSTIAVDEAQSLIFNRSWHSKLNTSIGQVLVQIRKRRLEMLFTTQNALMLDKLAIFQIDLLCIAEKLKGGRAVRLYCFDLWGQWTGHYQLRPFPPVIGEHDWTVLLYPTDRQFNNYREEEIVGQAGSASRETIINEYYKADGSLSDEHGKPMQTQAQGNVLSVPNAAEVKKQIDLAKAEEGLVARLKTMGTFPPFQWLEQAQGAGIKVTDEANFTWWLKDRGFSVIQRQSGNGVKYMVSWLKS